ncbi:MAG: transketolase family protein [Candidatus Fimenecus sp.]
MAENKYMATRDAYGDALKELGALNKNVFVMDADLAESTRTSRFRDAYPERFIDCGIAEGNMISTAAGIASLGLTVFASSFAMFAAGRAFEQVRNSIGYPKLNVKIGATHAGISVGEDGASHQCNEDIAIMRSIPEMVIINPADYEEAKKAVFAAAEYNGPVYLRFGRLAVPQIFDKTYNFKIGKGNILTEGNDATIIATGLMVNEAIIAAKLLKNEGIFTRVVNMATIKPIDRELIISCAKETGTIVTAEEHSIIGGLGSAVSEVITETVPIPVIKVGVMDVFGTSGPAKELLDIYGLNAKSIAEAVKKAIKLK